MKAAQINQYGDATTVKVQEIDKPAASEGQILVEVHASSINPFDIAVRSGYVKDRIPLELPVTLGGDFAGVVTAVGPGVMQLAAGDRIYGQAAAVAGNSGAFAEFAVTKLSQAAKMPANLDFNQAASLPLVGVSAYQALYEHLKLAAGRKILITGGAGGIGSIAVQIAKHLGAMVITTARGKSGAALAKELGADDVIDTASQDLSGLPKDFDAVFDTVGGNNFNGTLRLLKPGGTAVSMIAQPDAALAKELDVTAMVQQTKVDTVKLDALRQLVESGIVQPQVGQVFPLDKITEAFQAKESGRVNGKIVVQVK